MTHQDIKAALDIAKEVWLAKLDVAVDRLEKKVGEKTKRRVEETQAQVFARALATRGGTFEFTMAMKEFGYETIWQAMAGEMTDPTARPMVKAQNAESEENTYRHGYYGLNKLMQEWFSDVQVIAVPRTATSQLIEVITTNPDIVVNAAGQTAGEVFDARMSKQATGQMRSLVVKSVRYNGVEATREKVNALAQQALSEVVRPIGRLEGPFDDK